MVHGIMFPDYESDFLTNSKRTNNCNVVLLFLRTEISLEESNNNIKTTGWREGYCYYCWHYYPNDSYGSHYLSI